MLFILMQNITVDVLCGFAAGHASNQSCRYTGQSLSLFVSTGVVDNSVL